MQSKLQYLLGIMSTPNEKPSLLDGTGPKTNICISKYKQLLEELKQNSYLRLY